MQHVAFDGIDASGKTSQARRALGFLAQRGRRCHYGKICRGGEFYARTSDMMRRLDALGDWGFWRYGRIAKAFDSVRVFHRVVSEARARGSAVCVWDRFDATHLAAALARFSYDPGAREVLAALPRPDIGFLLDLPPETSYRRLAGRGEALTLDENPYMLTRYREAFLDVAPSLGWIVLDARCSEDELAEEIAARLHSSLLEEASPRQGCDHSLRIETGAISETEPALSSEEADELDVRLVRPGSGGQRMAIAGGGLMRLGEVARRRVIEALGWQPPVRFVTVGGDDAPWWPAVRAVAEASPDLDESIWLDAWLNEIAEITWPLSQPPRCDQAIVLELPWWPSAYARAVGIDRDGFAERAGILPGDAARVLVTGRGLEPERWTGPWLRFFPRQDRLDRYLEQVWKDEP